MSACWRSCEETWSSARDKAVDTTMGQSTRSPSTSAAQRPQPLTFWALNGSIFPLRLVIYLIMKPWPRSERKRVAGKVSDQEIPQGSRPETYNRVGCNPSKTGSF